jgi:hypothetical protein
MQQRTLGSQGLRVSTIGLGCMPMSQLYGPADECWLRSAARRAGLEGVQRVVTTGPVGLPSWSGTPGRRGPGMAGVPSTQVERDWLGRCLLLGSSSS